MVSISFTKPIFVNDKKAVFVHYPRPRSVVKAKKEGLGKR